jgi:hypothetical protein
MATHYDDKGGKKKKQDEGGKIKMNEDGELVGDAKLAKGNLL